MVQVVEHGLGHLPFTEKCVVTATGHPYIGVDFAKKLCGVSIIRSGESMENALRACCKGIKIGKILVHRCARAPRLPHHPRPCAGKSILESCAVRTYSKTAVHRRIHPNILRDSGTADNVSSLVDQQSCSA